MPAAVAKPIWASDCRGAAMRAAKVPARIRPADVITRPVPRRPSTTALSVGSRPTASRTRPMKKML